jgi:hypothetical protein
MNKKLISIALMSIMCSASSWAVSEDEVTSFVVKASLDKLTRADVFAGKIQPLANGYFKVGVTDERLADAHVFFGASGIVAEKDVAIIRDNALYIERHVNLASAMEQSFNDPQLATQTELTSSLNGVLVGMKYQRDKNKEVNVLIVDSGSLAHEDVVFSGGYNFVTETSGRVATDYEDYTGSRACVSGHGLAMAGIIGAKQNNGKGIAGIADAKLYMARVIQRDCVTQKDVGALSDVYKALTGLGSATESRIPIPDVVNISLAAETVCPSFLQEAIDGLVLAGSTVVVSSGNNGGLAASFTPANCQNVIVVGAHKPNGEMHAFTNLGSQVDVSVIGERFTSVNGNAYAVETGTSGAAAAVSGYVAVLKQMFPSMTPSQAEYVLKNSSSPFLPLSGCLNDCGQGMGDLFSSLVMSEKIINPTLSFSHAFDDNGQCLIAREKTALNILLGRNSCGAIVSSIKTSYAEDASPVSYSIRLLRRTVGTATWLGVGVDVMADYKPTINSDMIPIVGANTVMYDYGVAACFDGEDGAKKCPYVVKLDPTKIRYPTGCN